MERIRCKYCKSDNINEDMASGMWYCPYCSRYLDEDELLEEVEEVKKVSKEETDESELSESSSVEDYEEELSGLSLIVLNIMMYIPIINIFMTNIVCRSDVKNQYRKAFCYRLVVDLAAFLAVFVVAIFSVYKYKYDLRVSVHEVMDSVVSVIGSVNKYDIPVLNADSLDIWEIIESRREDTTDINDESGFVFDWKYIDGATLSGSKSVELLDGIGTDVIILMQSAEIRNRYSKTAYRNVGYLMDGAYLKDKSESYFYDGKLPEYVSRYLDDYGEEVFIDTEDLYKQRYIYYVNPKLYYTVHVLYGEDMSMQGIALEEVAK